MNTELKEALAYLRALERRELIEKWNQKGKVR